jgi:hypothetical protein
MHEPFAIVKFSGGRGADRVIQNPTGYPVHTCSVTEALSDNGVSLSSAAQHGELREPLRAGWNAV